MWIYRLVFYGINLKIFAVNIFNNTHFRRNVVHRNGKFNVVATLAPLLFSESYSFLQVIRITIKSWMSLKFDQIVPLTGVSCRLVVEKLIFEPLHEKNQQSAYAKQRCRPASR